MDRYFKTIFFSKIWPKLGGRKLSNINFSLLNPMEFSKVLWESFVPMIDQYIFINKLWLKKGKRQRDINVFDTLVTKMYAINQLNSEEGKWYDSWPVTAIEKGPTNCSLGSQVLGRILQQSGYEVEFGMPGPISHSVIFARAKDGKIHYLDPAN